MWGWHANRLVLGKHSGRAAVKARFEELGISFDTPEALADVFVKFKELADKKHEIFDEDLQALVSEVTVPEVAEKYQLVTLEAHTQTGSKPSAAMSLLIDGQPQDTSAQGRWPR